MIKVLSINSNANILGELASGHAWIGIHYQNGHDATVGLWTRTLTALKDSFFVPEVVRNFGDFDFDIQWNLEKRKGYRALSRRYYSFDGAKYPQFLTTISRQEMWRYTNTCATWATAVIKQFSAETLESTELLGITNTPRALSAAIERAELVRKTTLDNPL